MSVYRYSFAQFSRDMARLGMKPGDKVTAVSITRRRNMRMKKAHPDVPDGSTKQATELNEAADNLREWIKQGAIPWPELEGRGGDAPASSAADKAAQDTAKATAARAQAAAATASASARAAAEAARVKAQAEAQKRAEAHTEAEAIKEAEFRVWRDQVAAEAAALARAKERRRVQPWLRLIGHLLASPAIALLMLAGAVLESRRIKGAALVLVAAIGGAYAWPHLGKVTIPDFLLTEAQIKTRDAPHDYVWNTKTRSYLPFWWPQPTTAVGETSDEIALKNAPPGYTWDAWHKRYVRWR